MTLNVGEAIRSLKAMAAQVCAAAPLTAPALTIGLALSVQAAHAATVTSDGVTGLILDGTSYDIEFVEGTCASVFDGCDEQSDFALNSSNIVDAIQALSDAINGTLFDRNVSLINGCEDEPCEILTAYTPEIAGDERSVGIVQEFDVEFLFGSPLDSTAVLPVSIDLDTASPTNLSEYVWSRWTETSVPDPSPIPLPAGLPLLLGGVGALAALRARKSRSQ